VFRTEDQSERATSALGEWWAGSGWTWLLMAAIVALSAVGAFTAVRAWYVPVRATGLVPATLTIDTQPPGAELLIDTVSRGTAPLTVTLEPGSHLVAVRRSGLERQVRITVAAGVQMSQYFDLMSSVPATSPGRLSILTYPPGARVTVDAQLRGVSPLVIENLAEGEHTISVTSDAGSARRSVAVSASVAKEVVFEAPRVCRRAVSVSYPTATNTRRHRRIDLATSAPSQRSSQYERAAACRRAPPSAENRGRKVTIDQRSVQARPHRMPSAWRFSDGPSWSIPGSSASSIAARPFSCS